jgi:CheY-like chemotaxis protein
MTVVILKQPGIRVFVNTSIKRRSSFYEWFINRNLPHTAMNTKKLKILIAEDNKTADLLFTIVLEEYAYKILHAETGIEAVAICRENPDIDLLVMDVKMPEMDGYEASRQIRLFNKNIVIIAQTAYVLPGERDKAIEAGCNDFLSKPLRINELLAIIDNYFNS